MFWLPEGPVHEGLHEIVITQASAQVLQSVNVNAVLDANSETLPSFDAAALCATRQAIIK